jgi:hypothetical protein
MEENNQKNKVTIDDLALMVARGFNDVNEKMDKGFKNLEMKLEKKIVDTSDELRAELNKKVDVFTHKDLEFRVEKLEERAASTRIK